MIIVLGFLIYCRNCKLLCEILIKNGIIIRNIENEINNCIRISYSNENIMQKLYAILRNINFKHYLIISLIQLT